MVDRDMGGRGIYRTLSNWRIQRRPVGGGPRLIDPRAEGGPSARAQAYAGRPEAEPVSRRSLAVWIAQYVIDCWGEAEAPLQRIIDDSKSARDALRDRDNRKLMRFDLDLEHSVGEKERAFGALREHQREHRC